ncbi:NAD(P)/FAD-dependent oxidoreductase [Paenibacillus hamazuiensis]|uniref:NAD(P)/FAD-dependent oxidoreductase n=1 Tax=Paenibacillus hamazuiensis TaxID=2936508 RepID=UPI00200E6743|nr:NAD(P)/FAD-dependent oxidoreductase [Paenibacillus hamazuiensis]
MYESIIIGGGIAGLQAAILLGRMQHKVLVIDAGVGRSTLCKSYHNVLGWPNGISGKELRETGQLQAKKFGVEFVRGQATGVMKSGEAFKIAVSPVLQMSETKVAEAALVGAAGSGAGTARAGGPPEQTSYEAQTLLVATGVMDRFPELPGLVECLGLSVYVCPDCDGFEVKDRRTVIMGAGNTGANMALTLHYFTQDIIYVNHEQKPVDPPLLEQLRQKGIDYREEAIEKVLTSPDKEGEFLGVKLTGGCEIRGERGFIAFGGNEVRSSVVDGLGVERLENKHIATDPRTKMTSVPRVWAAGDVGVHAEQLTIAMGEGSQAAIWMHKELLKIRQSSGSSK